MQLFSLTRNAFVALLIQLALFRLDGAVNISLSIGQNNYLSKGKIMKMPITCYGGYLLKHHIVNTMTEFWAITMLNVKLPKIYVSYNKGTKRNVWYNR